MASKGNGIELPENYEARLATSETRIDSVASDVSKVANAVDKLARTVTDGFQQIHDRITAQQRTNWPTIFGGFVVIATIFGVYLQGPIGTLNRLDNQIHDVAAQNSINEYHRGRNDEARERLKVVTDELEMRLRALEHKP